MPEEIPEGFHIELYRHDAPGCPRQFTYTSEYDADGNEIITEHPLDLVTPQLVPDDQSSSWLGVVCGACYLELHQVDG